MICTLKLARYIYPEFEAHNLQYLRYRLGLEFAEEINPHDALSDVIVLEKLFLHLSKKLAEKMAIEINNDPAKLNDDTTLIQKMTDITQAPSLLHKCIFGKYAGTLWREVPREYLEWIVFKSSFDDADVLYTARHYLSNNSQLPL
jgi:exodeoxyribonuclease X